MPTGNPTPRADPGPAGGVTTANKHSRTWRWMDVQCPVTVMTALLIAATLTMIKVRCMVQEMTLIVMMEETAMIL